MENEKEYLDAIARAAMCATMAIADHTNTKYPQRANVKDSRSRIRQIEEYCTKAREALSNGH